MIESIYLKNFTVFNDLDMKLSPKINVILGENGTGKTHILKAIYTMSSLYRTDRKDTQIDERTVRETLTSKLINTMMPIDAKLWKLRKSDATREAFIKTCSHDIGNFEISFNFNSKKVSLPTSDSDTYSALDDSEKPVFIPAKEICFIVEGLKDVPTTTIVTHMQALHFDETYTDLIKKLTRPSGADVTISEKSEWILSEIKKIVRGSFVHDRSGNLVFRSFGTDFSVNVMAEGFRKLGTLCRLIENGSLIPGNGAPLLWDEPDSNLNPLLIELLAQILVELSREGLQIILATHNYHLIKWLDLLNDKNQGDEIRFHALYRNPENRLVVVNEYAEKLSMLLNNPIQESFRTIINKEIEDNLGGVGK
jgi:hypothetical protein